MLSAIPKPPNVRRVHRENGVILFDTAAPRGWTYCAICRGWQHPRWHQPEWREEQKQDNASLANLWSYTQPPETPHDDRDTRHYEPS